MSALVSLGRRSRRSGGGKEAQGGLKPALKPCRLTRKKGVLDSKLLKLMRTTSFMGVVEGQKCNTILQSCAIDCPQLAVAHIDRRESVCVRACVTCVYKVMQL